MSKSQVILVSILMFSVGVVLGLLLSPIKHGLKIGNNSGNTTNNYYDKEKTE